MGLHVKLMGCNGLCRRCYENRIRSVHHDTSYDIEAIIATIERETEKIPKDQRHNTICLHGGEPLMMKFEDLDRVLNKIHSLYGCTNIQTNAVLINDQHIELFKKYKTSIGVSIDGDTAQLNLGRWNMAVNGKQLTMEQVQKMTDKTLWNLKRVKDAGLGLSMIALLSRYNATEENISGFIRFLRRMRNEFGVVHVRTNEAIIFEKEDREEEALTNEELGWAYCRLADLCFADPDIMWLPYRDIVNMLFGYINDTTCVFTECDIWDTRSERTIMADGSLGSCLKGGDASDGIQALRVDATQPGKERYIALHQIPQEQGGCKDCRYWHMCKGGCPGEGIDNDWRNRMRYCEAWKILFAHVEKKIRGLLPNIYTLPMFYPVCPSPQMIQHALGLNGSVWKENKRKNLDELKKNAGQYSVDPYHGDSDHGDQPHGDAHGDSDHGDGHGDGHGDSYGDGEHRDSEYGDIGHGDSDHGDSDHGDLAHGDSPHGDGHGDGAHVDSGHQDGHGDEHGDSYGDKSHGDDHGDKHGDTPHGDGHGDSDHGDGHGDSGHGDIGHGDAPHGDS